MEVEPNHEEQLLAPLTVAAFALLYSMPEKAAASIDEQQVAVGLSPVVLPTIVTLAVADPLMNIGASTPTSAQLASANKEAFFGGLPANVMLRLRGPGLGLNVRTSAAREKLPEATGYTEHLDLAFSDDWDSLDAVGQIRRA